MHSSGIRTASASIDKERRTLSVTYVQIAIMGCIVNGPGEMADADFGYVGGAPGKIDLYVGKVSRRLWPLRSEPHADLPATRGSSFKGLLHELIRGQSFWDVNAY
jgi:sulfite reductase beta subunit-like hemoprotein